MSQERKQDPLHGVTLEMMIKELHTRYGWEALGEMLDVNCFKNNPSLKSSLNFFRKTPWARTKIEKLYLADKVQRDT